jgi:site-specific DNA recombinase
LANTNVIRRQGSSILARTSAGRVVWNRVKMIKDPDTGRRISRSNPPEEWKRAEAPHLAIVDMSLFDAAQQRKAERTFEAPQKQRKAKFLLSGLLKCGCCGGGLSMKDRDHGRVRVHCSTMRESGSCSNRKIFYLDEIEKAVLAGLQQHLKAPHLLKEFAKAYQEERERLASEKRRLRGKLEGQLAQLQRGIDRLWADYEAERLPMDIAGPKLKELHAQRTSIQEEIAAKPVEEKIVGLHPAALREYEEHVGRLQAVFGQGVTPDYEETSNKIRGLIADVTLRPSEEGFKIELQGRLALLMGASNLYPNMRLPRRGDRW